MGVIRLGNDVDAYVIVRKIVNVALKAVRAFPVLHVPAFSLIPKGDGRKYLLYKKGKAGVSCCVLFLLTHPSHGAGRISGERR